jgi:uncharacterized iron-regulated protein
MNARFKAAEVFFPGALAAALLSIVLSSPPAGARAGEAPWLDWRTKLHADSHVIGVYAVSPKGPAKTTPDKLIEKLAEADYVLLGEIHDNPDHHRLQAWIIGRLAQKGRRPVVAFEMIDAGQEEALRAYLARSDASADGLGAALKWKQHGWPAWTMYKPVAEAALKASRAGAGPAILSAGGPAREMVRAVSRGNLHALIPKSDLERLGLNRKLPEALAADLKEELFETHCRLMPREAMAPLVSVQRLRDASFADRMIRAGERVRAAGGGSEGSGSATIVLIAGGGHVRKDRGAPYYVLNREPGAKLAAVIFAEASGEARSPGQIEALEPGGAPKADFVWVTPAAEREDQCELLRKRLEKKKEHSDKSR